MTILSQEAAHAVSTLLYYGYVADRTERVGEAGIYGQVTQITGRITRTDLLRAVPDYSRYIRSITDTDWRLLDTMVGGLYTEADTDIQFNAYDDAYRLAADFADAKRLASSDPDDWYPDE